MSTHSSRRGPPLTVYYEGEGKQGFQKPIQNDSLIVDGMGALGTAHSERGLTYYEVALSGHMCVPFLPCLILRADGSGLNQDSAILANGEWLMALPCALEHR